MTIEELAYEIDMKLKGTPAHGACHVIERLLENYCFNDADEDKVISFIELVAELLEKKS